LWIRKLHAGQWKHKRGDPNPAPKRPSCLDAWLDGSAHVMLELEQAQQVSPASITAELATARRIAATLCTRRDRDAIQSYIVELETELASCMAISR
jgi:hypothetical protein